MVSRSNGRRIGWGITSDALYGATEAVGSVAAPLNGGTALACTDVIVQCDDGSAGSILVGGQGSVAFKLIAGRSVTIPVNNVASLYVQRAVAGTAGSVNWIARS